MRLTMRIFGIALTACALIAGIVGIIALASSGSSTNSSDKAAAAYGTALAKQVVSQATVIQDRYNVAADKAIVVVDSDALLGLSNVILVKDTQRVIADLRLTSTEFAGRKWGRLLQSVDAAGCVPCSRLIEAAM